MSTRMPRPREKQVTFRMTWPEWEEMHVVTAVTGQTQRVILNRGFRAYVNSLPAEDRRLIQSILTTRRRKHP
jgi:hypothetical protein